MRLDGSTPDAYFPGSMQFGGVGTGGDEIDDGSTPSYTYNFGTPGNTSIVRINGDAHLRAGAQLTGHGILIVEGDLTVDAGAVLDWDGFVYLRPKESYSQSRFDGLVNIRGALLAYQEAIPPGSHMDVTTHRDLTGTWSIPRGTEANQAGIPIPGPWFVHRHKWDQQWNARPPIAVDRVVTFLRNGTAPATHENYLRFSESLQDFLSAGITDIYLKFDNRSQNGMGTFLFEYTDPATGALRTRSGSIPSGFDGSGSVTSPTIPVASLRSMEMQFRSLRLLQFMQDPDPNGSLDDGAHRVSNDHSRQGSFHLEIYDAATDRLIMTTSVYQHIREDEDDEYEEELNQLHDDIVNGHFGLNLVLGPYTQFVYDESSVADAMDRIRPRQVAHLGSWTQRCNQIDATCNLTSAP